MPSHIKYTFMSQRATRTIEFDGHCMTVRELRSLIIDKHRLDDRQCLILSDKATGKDYDDADIVTRSSVVLCRRVPKQNYSRVLVGATPPPPPPPPPPPLPLPPPPPPPLPPLPPPSVQEDRVNVAADAAPHLGDVEMAREVGDGPASSFTGRSTRGWGKRTMIGAGALGDLRSCRRCNETGRVDILFPTVDDPELVPPPPTIRPTTGIPDQPLLRPKEEDERGGGGAAAWGDVAEDRDGDEPAHKRHRTTEDVDRRDRGVHVAVPPELEELLCRPSYRTLQQMPPVYQMPQMPPAYQMPQMPPAYQMPQMQQGTL